MLAAKAAWGKSVEVQSQIDSDKDHYFRRFGNTLRAIQDGWYAEQKQPVVFDKCRNWNAFFPLLNSIRKAPKMIVCVRDLRGIFASIVKQDAKSQLYGQVLPPTLKDKLDNVFAPSGVVGSQLKGIMDLAARGSLSRCFVLKYETLCSQPQETMKAIYNYLGHEPYSHDFENVERSTQEDDSVYRYNYPHRGEGKIQPAQTNAWKKSLPPIINTTIRAQHNAFFQTFNYDPKEATCPT